MKTWKYLALILLISPSICSAGIKFGTLPDVQNVAPDAVPTPQAEVDKIIQTLPPPEVGFVDFGAGSDARWCIAAARRWKCKVTGVEIDPVRAAQARRRVREAGLDNLITIVEGDAITTDVKADVAAVYLYPETLIKLRPKLEKMRAFASYMHQPPGVQSVQVGNSWIYTRPVQARGAVWGGQVYSGPVCNNPNCGMCNAIRAQLAAQVNQQTSGLQEVPRGHYETRKVCNGRSCWFAQVWVQD